jgi:predicted HicB family RNase H-like nuclease
MIGKILIRAPIELKDILQKEARQKGISLNAIVLKLLWEYVEKKR